METQAEFIERRRREHERAAIDAGNDPLIRALFGPFERVEISKAERDAYCLRPGWMWRHQAT